MSDIYTGSYYTNLVLRIRLAENEAGFKDKHSIKYLVLNHLVEESSQKQKMTLHIAFVDVKIL